jgi:hypothetical protein
MNNKDIEDIIIEYCEGFEHLEFNYSDLPEMAEKIRGELATENHRLHIALHEAINRPKGIVPLEAEEFYDQDFYSTKSVDSSQVWWCPECRQDVEPDMVTFEETHDARYGGCGGDVLWQHKEEHKG